MFNAVKDSFECPNDVQDRVFVAFKLELALALIFDESPALVEVTLSMFISSLTGVSSPITAIVEINLCSLLESDYCEGSFLTFCWHEVGVSHSSNRLIYALSWALASFTCIICEIIVRLSTYVYILSAMLVGIGKLWVNRLKERVIEMLPTASRFEIVNVLTLLIQKRCFPVDQQWILTVISDSELKAAVHYLCYWNPLRDRVEGFRNINGCIFLPRRDGS